MANPWDVGARLAEGRPAVDDLAEYVMACSRLGYQHQDLTAYPTQVRDWYDREVGLDLRGLDADCAALAGAATAAEDAARTHTDLVAELSGAWTGRGAAAAREFTWRSGQAATTVSSAVRGAADALTALREELWRVVDAKVTTVQDIGGRHREQRGEWLAAARTVTTGVGDLAAASEFVDHHVKPFVANDIGSEWVGAMRAAIASIGAAYDAAIAGASRGPHAVFDVPGALGPRAEPAEVGPGREPDPGIEAITPAISGAATVFPAGMPSMAAVFNPSSVPMGSPGWSGSAPAVDSTAGAPTVPAAAVPAMPSAASVPPMPSMGDLGGATPGLGSGVSGFGQQLADLIGGLVGSFGGGDDLTGSDVEGSGRVDPAAEDDEVDVDATDEETGEATDEEADETEEGNDAVADEGTEVIGELDEETVEDPPPPEAPEPIPISPPPAPEPPPPAPAEPEAVAEIGSPTPCEIAADELPQVGE